jgi:hypothetical protein
MTLDVIESHASALSELAAAISDPTVSEEYIEEPSFTQSDDGEEQALEVHEVIELQAYDERKWISEQIQVRSCCWLIDMATDVTWIQFLEHLPPIDIFASLDLIRSTKAPLPGLPTRQELEAWVANHAAIDKQADVLEKGKLRKLKKVTAGASSEVPVRFGVSLMHQRFLIETYHAKTRTSSRWLSRLSWSLTS